MSRHYSMALNVSENLTESELNLISDAIEDLWEWDTTGPIHIQGKVQFFASGESYLRSGKSEAEFAKELSLKIWKAIGRYAEVEILATYLDDLPYEVYKYDKHDYEEMMNG